MSAVLVARANTKAIIKSDYPISPIEHIFNKIPANTTPIDLAVEKHSVALLELLMHNSDEVRSNHTDTESHNISLAVQYQSIHIIRHTCEGRQTNISAINHFDKYGYSALYYALEPDFFYGFFLHHFDDAGPSLPPATPKEVLILRMLAYGSNLRVVEDDSFNCLHLAANLGEPEILKTLLESQHCNKYVNDAPRVKKQINHTPVTAAILMGHREAFKILLENGASIKTVHDPFPSHALHEC